jgi:hypothetical protein
VAVPVKYQGLQDNPKTHCMKKFLFLPLLMIGKLVLAQVPEDALRYAFYPQNGSARSLAIGGAMGSLGGDISTVFVNPAGLGNYRTSEFVFTPGLFYNNNKTDFRGTNNQNNKNSFGVGASGFVVGYGDVAKPNRSHALSFAFTQTASFNNSVHYSGYNNYSSYAEQWAEQVGKSGESIDQVLNDPQYAYGSAPALYTYLVDTFRVNDSTVRLKSMPEFVLDQGNALLQQTDIETRGGIYEIAIGHATNYNDKLLVGWSVGIPIFYYQSNTTYTETDTSSDHHNNFGYFKYNDNFTITGAGLNLKIGAIYKPSDRIRLGFAFHTPTIYPPLKETRTTTLDAQTEDYHGSASISSDLFNNGQAGVSSYNLTTPLKAIISGSYVISEIADVTKQRGFITADIEYVNYHGTKFSSEADSLTVAETNYYNALNDVIKSQYKGTFNFRVGGELKFNTIMGRLGFAYYGNPYKDPALKANKILLSAGGGYRNNNMFIDLTYVYSINKDVNFPYRLEDKSNTFADVKDLRGNLVLTVGFKL